MKRLNWTPQRWATEAGTSPTNITRALKPDEKPVMTFKTQDILARAARVPSALDYLSGMAVTVETREVVSATTLQLALVEVLRQSAGVEIPEPVARPTAEALRLCLQLLEENPAIHDNEDAIKVLVRAATARPHEARPEA